jgi:hypothetical protein
VDSHLLYSEIAEKGCSFLAERSAPKIPGTLVLKDKDNRACAEEAYPALLELDSSVSITSYSCPPGQTKLYRAGMSMTLGEIEPFAVDAGVAPPHPPQGHHSP